MYMNVEMHASMFECMNISMNVCMYVYTYVCIMFEWVYDSQRMICKEGQHA